MLMPDAETRTGKLLRLGDGDLPIVGFRLHEGVEQSVEDADENLRVVTEARPSQPCGLVVDIRHSAPLSAEVRHRYHAERISGFCGFALVVAANPLGRTMGNLYLRIAKPTIPTRMFSDFDEAVEWLRGFR